ncbi:MAG: hypothetical protein P8M80_18225 [Pirellulaceae bacterium]|nr:hypothetical protein [Pirellulaceae bacterium]
MNGTDRNRTRRDPSKNLAKVDKRPLWGILANFQFFLESLLSKSLRGMLSVALSCLLLPKDLIDRLDPPLANPANLMRPAMSLFYPLTMNPAFYSKNPRLGLSSKPPHLVAHHRGGPNISIYRQPSIQYPAFLGAAIIFL